MSKVRIRCGYVLRGFPYPMLYLTYKELEPYIGTEVTRYRVYYTLRVEIQGLKFDIHEN